MTAKRRVPRPAQKSRVRGLRRAQAARGGKVQPVTRKAPVKAK